jgi:hypothetical protein
LNDVLWPIPTFVAAYMVAMRFMSGSLMSMSCAPDITMRGTYFLVSGGAALDEENDAKRWLKMRAHDTKGNIIPVGQDMDS